jgi:hypothetical protein
METRRSNVKTNLTMNTEALRQQIKDKMKACKAAHGKEDFSILDERESGYLRWLLDNVPERFISGSTMDITISTNSKAYSREPGANNRRKARITGVEVCPKEIQRFYSLVYRQGSRSVSVKRLESTLVGVWSKDYRS